MKILITGTEGFIGSHLCELLVKKGHKVKAITQYNFRNSYGWLDNLPKNIIKNIDIVPGDIRDLYFLINQTKKIDVV